MRRPEARSGAGREVRRGQASLVPRHRTCPPDRSQPSPTPRDLGASDRGQRWRLRPAPPRPNLRSCRVDARRRRRARTPPIPNGERNSRRRNRHQAPACPMRPKPGGDAPRSEPLVRCARGSSPGVRAGALRKISTQGRSKSAEAPAETRAAAPTRRLQAHKRILAPDPDAPKLQRCSASLASARDATSGTGSSMAGSPSAASRRTSITRLVRRPHPEAQRAAGQVHHAAASPPVLAYHKPVGEVVTRDDPQQRPTVFRSLPTWHGKSGSRSAGWTSTPRACCCSRTRANSPTSSCIALRRPGGTRCASWARFRPSSLDNLLASVPVEGQPASFKSIEGRRRRGANHWYRVVITEGRNREVRKLFDAVGLTVSRLIRIRYGTVVLPRGLRRRLVGRSRRRRRAPDAPARRRRARHTSRERCASPPASAATRRAAGPRTAPRAPLGTVRRRRLRNRAIRTTRISTSIQYIPNPLRADLRPPLRAELALAVSAAAAAAERRRRQRASPALSAAADPRRPDPLQTLGRLHRHRRVHRKEQPRRFAQQVRRWLRRRHGRTRAAARNQGGQAQPLRQRARSVQFKGFAHAGPRSPCQSNAPVDHQARRRGKERDQPDLRPLRKRRTEDRRHEERTCRWRGRAFYAVHKARPFFADLVAFMTSGPGDPGPRGADAIAKNRQLMGATDPKKAERAPSADFADSIDANAVHGSDAPDRRGRGRVLLPGHEHLQPLSSGPGFGTWAVPRRRRGARRSPGRAEPGRRRRRRFGRGQDGRDQPARLRPRRPRRVLRGPGRKRFRATQLFQWIHQRGVSDFAAMSDLAKPLRSLAGAAVVAPLAWRASRRRRTARSSGCSTSAAATRSRRCSSRGRSGDAVHFVAGRVRGRLPLLRRPGHWGFSRNLDRRDRGPAAPRRARAARPRRGAERAISNVVMMGMGEPLQNYAALLPALRTMLDDHGYGLSRRRLTVSTSGVVPMIERLREGLSGRARRVAACAQRRAA